MPSDKSQVPHGLPLDAFFYRDDDYVDRGDSRLDIVAQRSCPASHITHKGQFTSQEKWVKVMEGSRRWSLSQLRY
jgi:hypothetical protein